MLTEAQVVTVPVLDARLAVLDHKIDLVESRLERRIDLVESRLERKIDLVKLELEGRIEMAKTQLDGKIDVAVERLAKFGEATKAELVRWVFVTMVGSVVLQGMVSAIVNGFMRH